MTQLAEKRCVPCEGGVPSLDLGAAVAMREHLHDRWQLIDGGNKLQARFEFRNYFRTLAFVNAVAYVATQEDHHPEIEFGFKDCRIRYWTHAAEGLTENDFICAAKIDKLID